MRKKTDGRTWTCGPTNASFTPYLNRPPPPSLTTGAFCKGGGPANEIIGLGILEVPKSPRRGSVTSQLNGWVALYPPPPEVAELAPWENPRGREDRHRNRISSLSAKIEGISDRLSVGPLFLPPTHFIYAKLMIRAGTTNAAAAAAAAARARHARHGAKTRVITAMISKDNLQLPLRMHIKRRRRWSPDAAKVQTFLAT